MAAVECISPGEFLVILSDRYTEEKIIPKGFEVEHIPAIRRRSGEPLKVVAIGAPFLICERVTGQDNKARFVDSRYETWTKVDEQYVREYCRLERHSIPEILQRPEELEKTKQAKKSLCPVCLEKMSERQVMGRPGWNLACAGCELELVPYQSSRSQ